VHSLKVFSFAVQLRLMWKNENNALTANFKFKNFKECFEFMSIIAQYAEEVNHHPTWTNTYNNLEIKLTTHDTGGVSEKDHKMSAFISEQFDKFN
jgi:4a-hydroxytetrahydrobiopterin dehydratase